MSRAAAGLRLPRLPRVVWLLWLLWLPAAPAAASIRSALLVSVNELTTDLSVLLVPVMPGATLTVHVTDPAGKRVRGEFDGRDLALRDGRASLSAPWMPGHYPLHLRSASASASASTTLNIFVMHPHQQVRKERLNGFRVGTYPRKPLNGLSAYEPPPGFIEVNERTADVQVSPSYRLGEFVSKQAGGYPKYLVLRPRLLIKLELIAEELRKAGHAVDKFVIMSGYRTPYYNRAIGNVRFSRHVWGGAADIYVDQSPRDGKMDDLNGDGVSNRADADYLRDFINDLARAGKFGGLRGGLGAYGATAAHGPFVHVDVRGRSARW